MFTDGKEVMIGANSDEYHAQTAERGTPEFVVSSSALREFANCPARWRAGYEAPDSKAKHNGSLLDCMLLTPEQFDNRYALRPDTYVNDDGETKKWNANSNVCKGWLARHEDKEIVTQAHLDECAEAIDRLKEDETIAAWLEACDPQVWLTANWQDEKTGLVIPCKALIDFRPRLDTEFQKTLGDLKSTRNAAILPWQRWCFSAGYHVQAAFYADIYAAAHPDEDRNTWVFIIQENYAPWQPGKRMLSQDFLDLGRATYRQMLANYCACVKSGRWPSYDETDEALAGGWTLVQAESFMINTAAFAPHYVFDAEEDNEIPDEQTDIIP